MLCQRHLDTARSPVVKRLSSTDFIEFSSRLRRFAGMFFALVVLEGLVTSAHAIRIARVRTPAESAEVSQLQKVPAVDPDKPKLHSWLSLVYRCSLEQVHLPVVVAQGPRAPESNPGDFACCWNLALAGKAIEDNACAEQAFQWVLILGPRKARLWWATGPSISSPADPRELLAATQGIGRGASANGHSYSGVMPEYIQVHAG